MVGIHIKKYCKCGCGKEIIILRHHKWKGIPDYINYHYYRVDGNKKIQSKKVKGKNNPFYGKHHTEETGQKISKANSVRIISNETKQKQSKFRKGKKHSDISKKKMSEFKKGKNNPAWNGGISFLPYCEKWTNDIREFIRNKYDRKCFNCELDEKHNITKTNKVRKLSVHHIDYDKEQGCNEKNFELIPLCGSCHMKTNFNR